MPEELKTVAGQLRGMASNLSDLSNTVMRVRHTNDRLLAKTEKLDEAIALIRKAQDNLSSACTELMAAEYRLP